MTDGKERRTEPNVELIMATLSKILSRKYGCKITLTAEKKPTTTEGKAG